jgi:hypothetical protein
LRLRLARIAICEGFAGGVLHDEAAGICSADQGGGKRRGIGRELNAGRQRAVAFIPVESPMED